MHLSDARRLTIGGIEVLGGLWAFGFTADLLVNATTPSSRVVYGGLCLYFAAAFVAGFLLIRGHPSGARWSEWIQYPQLAYILSPLVSFHAYVGFAVMLTVDGALNIGLSGQWGGTFQFAHNTLVPVNTVGVNVLALVALWQLRAVRPTIAPADHTISQVSTG